MRRLSVRPVARPPSSRPRSKAQSPQLAPLTTCRRRNAGSRAGMWPLAQGHCCCCWSCSCFSCGRTTRPAGGSLVIGALTMWQTTAAPPPPQFRRPLSRPTQDPLPPANPAKRRIPPLEFRTHQAVLEGCRPLRRRFLPRETGSANSRQALLAPRLRFPTLVRGLAQAWFHLALCHNQPARLPRLSLVPPRARPILKTGRPGPNRPVDLEASRAAASPAIRALVLRARDPVSSRQTQLPPRLLHLNPPHRPV